MTRYAILAGLTRLDPDAYDGWDGHCPGCDRDVYRMGRLLHDRGFDGIEVLVNSAATIQGVKEAFVRAAKTLTDGDLLTLYVSGHGGQVDDIDGDEDDGKDETLALYDGEAEDDRIADYLRTIPKGVRVLFLTDSCNSGTNYRGMRRRKRSTPVKLASKSDGFKGSLLHYGGCSDGRYSYGDWDGGKFTNAMLDTIAKARKPLNYIDLFQRTSERMPSYQQPSIGQWGGPAFSDREVFT
jgi:hypothetical protein